MQTDRQVQLIYVHDPMCSWCWGFRPALAALIESLPRGIQVQRLLGGLAPDNDEPMDSALQQRLQATWRRIQERIPGTRFNFAFWQECTMILAIQTAYYTRALNPSDTDVLERLASEIGLDAQRFSERLGAAATEQALQREIAQTRKLGVRSFPTLLLRAKDQHTWPIPIDYRDADHMLDSIQRFIE